MMWFLLLIAVVATFVLIGWILWDTRIPESFNEVLDDLERDTK